MSSFHYNYFDLLMPFLQAVSGLKMLQFLRLIGELPGKCSEAEICGSPIWVLLLRNRNGTLERNLVLQVARDTITGTIKESTRIFTHGFLGWIMKNLSRHRVTEMGLQLMGDLIMDKEEDQDLGCMMEVSIHLQYSRRYRVTLILF